MNTEIPGINRIKGKKGNKTKIIILGFAVLLIAATVVTFITIGKKKTALVAQQRTATVTKGDLSISITGSSPLESSNRRELSPKVTTKIVKIYHKEGDQVKAGDVLFDLDNTDALLNVENTKNSIAQTQLTQQNNTKSVSGLYVKAPFNGQVSDVQLKSGDTVGKGSPVLTITDLSTLKVILPFNSIKGITKGQKATVYLQDLMQSVDGTVTYISSKPYTTAAGGELYNVEIHISNPGSLKDGMQASAELQTSSGVLTSVENGSLAFLNSTKIRSDAGGTLKSINIMDKQYVNAGDILMEIINDDLKLTLDTTALKLQNLQRQLEIQTEQLSYYKITAPNDGTIASESVKEGDTVKQGDVLAVLSDMGHMQFTVDIDELDISKVAVGQNVNITLDALSETTNKPLTGKVSKVAMEGSSSSGVTTYPVTVSVDASEKLKSGMNANAEIMISEKKDVLMVPLEAIQKMGNRSFVWVKGKTNSMPSFGGNGQNTGRSRNNTGTNGTDSSNQGQNRTGTSNGNSTQGNSSNTSGQRTQGNSNQSGAFSQMRKNFAAANKYYDGAGLVAVETGINNDTYIEITSGLNEGDIVILPQTTTSTKTTTTTQTAGFGGMFGGGGGAPMQGGGFPGNGNQRRTAGD